MTVQSAVGKNGMSSNGSNVVAIGSTATGTILSPVNNCSTPVASGTTSGHQECWICYDSDRSDAGPLIQPCSCKGDMSSVHHDCLKQWLMESTTTPGRTTSNPLINPDALIGNNGNGPHGQSNRRSFKQGGKNHHPVAAIKCSVCNEPYAFERSGTVWLPAGLTTKGWLKTGTILSIMCLTAAAFWFTVNSSDHFYVRVIGVGLTILVEYICLRFLGFNMLIAYNRAKVAAYRIAGRNWNPSSGRSGNGTQLASRVSRSSPSVPSRSIVKSRQMMAASVGHLACDTGTIRSSDGRRSVGSIMVQGDRRPSFDLDGHLSHPFVLGNRGRCDGQRLLPNPDADTLRPTSDRFRPSGISMSPIGATHLYRSVDDVSITMTPLASASSSTMSRSVDHSIGLISGHFSEA